VIGKTGLSMHGAGGISHHGRGECSYRAADTHLSSHAWNAG
jgi:hypothetical protein